MAMSFPSFATYKGSGSRISHAPFASSLIGIDDSLRTMPTPADWAISVTALVTPPRVGSTQDVDVAAGGQEVLHQSVERGPVSLAISVSNSNQLISKIIVPEFANDLLAPMHDGAIFR
jgi:hypothetical protein